VDDVADVLLTHLHPDHHGDLVALLFALHSPVPARTDPVRLAGPPGLRRLLEQLGTIYGRWLEPRRRELRVIEIGPGDVVALPGGGRVEAFPVEHPQDRLADLALGYRFLDRSGRVVVFSGDTGPAPALEKAAAGADLLVVECSCPDHLKTPGHMVPSEVGALCAAARPRRVALTHQYPDAAALDLAPLVNAIWDGPVDQAVDGSVYRVPEEE
jgi:ribonuclease BN (tRNA processing enzyme)